MIKEQEVSTRLPCRGCTSECKNYDMCAGKLWRQEPTAIQTNKVKPKGSTD